MKIVYIVIVLAILLGILYFAYTKLIGSTKEVVTPTVEPAKSSSLPIRKAVLTEKPVTFTPIKQIQTFTQLNP